MRPIVGTLLALLVLVAAPGYAQVRAAGMMLRDGELPPGTLTVRVVRGGFSNNLASQMVAIEVNGGNPQRAQTGPDGRATFAHLPVGSRVRAVASVAGEALESEVFDMPSESGVRVLLIAGGESADAAASGPPVPSAAAPIHVSTASAPVVTAAGMSGAEPQPSSPEATIASIRLVWVVLTLAMAASVSRQWWIPRKAAHRSDAGAAE